MLLKILWGILISLRIKNLHHNYCLQKIFRRTHRRGSGKKVFLKILPISQENTCVGISSDCNTGVFLWNLRSFSKPLFWRTFWLLSDSSCNKQLKAQFFNPSRPDPRQKEKISLNFYFHTSLWRLKRFYEGLLGLWKL